MYIYVKRGDDIILFPDVSLQDGYLPLVGSVGINLQLEPAVWFKSFVIDSVLLDCTRRVVLWSKPETCSGSKEERLDSDLDEQLKTLRLDNTLFDNYHFSELESQVEDLFVSGSKLFESYNGDDSQSSMKKGSGPSCINSELTESQEDGESYRPKNKSRETWKSEEILRLVHCYILPSIQLNSHDLPCVETALKCIESFLASKDKEIVSLDKAITLTETSLGKQRQSFVEDLKFESEAYIRSCNEEFLRVLLKHIEKDIAAENSDLEKLQKIVDSHRDLMDQESQKILAKARNDRDHVLKYLLSLQTVRENIKNVIVRPQVSKKKKKSRKPSTKVFHEIYLEIIKRLKEQKEDMHKLILQKVRISMVREATRIARQDLKKTGESVGFQNDSCDFGYSSFEFLGISGKPKLWSTLGEVVTEFINDPEKMEFIKHAHFCDIVLTKISGAISEMEMFDDSNTQTEVKNVKGEIGTDINWNISSDSASKYDEGIGKLHGSINSLGDSKSSDDSSLDLVTKIGELSQGRRSKYIKNIQEFSSNTSVKVNVLQPANSMSKSFSLEVVTEVLKDLINNHMDEMCRHILNHLPDHIKSKDRNEQETYRHIWLCYEPHVYENISGKLVDFYEKTHKKKASKLHKSIDGATLSDLGISEPWLFECCQNHPTAMEKTYETFDPDDTCVKVPIEDEELQQVEMRSNAPSSTRRQMSSDGLQVAVALGKIPIEQLYNYADRELDNISDIVPGVEALDLDLTIDSYHEENKNNIDAPPSYDDLDIETSPPSPESVSLSGSYHSEAEDVDQSVFQQFLPVVGCLTDSLSAITITSKIKLISGAFKIIGDTLLKLKPSTPDGSDILTVAIFIITKLDEDTFARLYAHMSMVLHLMPKFLEKNIHDWSLTNLYMSYQYLFDRHLLGQSRGSVDADMG